MIDISNRIELYDILDKLNGNVSPAFGAMTAQHMIEHLAFTIRFCNGKEPQQHYYPEEKEQKIKAFMLGTDNDMPIGFRSPVLPQEGLPALKCNSYAEAISYLKEELNDFDIYFKENPLIRPVNPTMGELDYKEWVRFHNRHFTHHFKQFKLIK